MELRIANWLLACAVAAPERWAMLGDLAEEYELRAVNDSRFTTACWLWSQVARSLPWALWTSVRRSGVWTTTGVAVTACAVQAAVEVTIARVLSGGIAHDVVVELGVVLLSLCGVSYGASIARPGAGTLVSLIALASVIGRGLHGGPAGLSLLALLEGASAPSAAFAGAVLAVNVRRH